MIYYVRETDSMTPHNLDDESPAPTPARSGEPAASGQSVGEKLRPRGPVKAETGLLHFAMTIVSIQSYTPGTLTPFQVILCGLVAVLFSQSSLTGIAALRFVSSVLLFEMLHFE